MTFRYALRGLRRSPGFTAVVILTLALGIGMNTAVFSVVNTVLLRQVPYPDAERLIWISPYSTVYESFRDTYLSRADYLIWREQARSFESMAAYGNQDLALGWRDEATQERVASITGDMWSMTGARPALGRLFAPGEPDLIVLTHGLWERRFTEDASVLGKTLTLNGHQFTIVGVLPRDYRFWLPQQFAGGDEDRAIDAFIPIPDAAEVPGQIVTQTRGPAPGWVRAIAKLTAGATLDQARAEMQTIYDRIAREYPGPLRKNYALRMTFLSEKLTRDARLALYILLGAVGFVLLVACANTANLLLARASKRQREIAIRAALGATRSHMTKQFLVESIIVSLAGGIAGLLLARWGIALIVRAGPQTIPRLAETGIDGTVLAFTLGVSLLTGLLFDVGPAISLCKTDPQGALQETTRSSTGGTASLRTRRLLIAGEVALAIILLTGAGLMLKSFWRMNSFPPGFAPEKTLIMRIALSGSRYTQWPAKHVYYQELLRRAESMPGVAAVGIDCATLNIGVTVDGAGTPKTAAIRAVSAGYLRAVGVPLVRGQWPGDEDLFTVVVNETFAKRFAGTVDIVGKRLTGSFFNDKIAAVVADFKHTQLDAEVRPEAYMPYPRSPFNRLATLVVRTAGDATPLAPATRKLAEEVDRTQPVYGLQTLEQALADSLAPRRFNLVLLVTFAATAVLLALIGIYGVIAYSVAQRTQEIGIRVALGARRGEIVRMVLREGMVMAGGGIVVGTAAAFALTRLMQSLLYDVEPHDGPTFALVVLTLGVTALAACCGPALRAALVDPMVALRHD